MNLPLVTRYVHNHNLSLTGAFRKTDYYYVLLTLEEYAEKYPREVALSHRRLNGSRARYHYEMAQMQTARKYFAKASLNLKTLIYYLTTFAGSGWIKKKYRVFG